MWALWSETQHRWYTSGGVVLCTPYRQIIRAQMMTIKAEQPDDYLSMCWVARVIGADGKPARTWKERVWESIKVWLDQEVKS